MFKGRLVDANLLRSLPFERLRTSSSEFTATVWERHFARQLCDIGSMCSWDAPREASQIARVHQSVRRSKTRQDHIQQKGTLFSTKASWITAKFVLLRLGYLNTSGIRNTFIVNIVGHLAEFLACNQFPLDPTLVGPRGLAQIDADSVHLINCNTH